MANVLPPLEKKRVIQSVRSRFVLAAALTLLAGAVIVALCLAPTAVFLRLAIAGLPEQVQVSETVRDDQAKQARIAAMVSTLSPIVGATTTPSASVGAALALKPVGLSVTSITYTKGRIVFSGSSRDRQAVNDYRESLEADTRYTSVAVPVAALVGTQEGRFTITLTGNF